MKKFLQQRNERLFNKLFENQGIKAQISENDHDSWKVVADFDVIKVKTPEGYMGQESMDLAFPGAVTAEDIALELAGGDERLAKKIEGNLLSDEAFLSAVKSAKNDSDDYSRDQKDGMTELNVAEMTAWQALEEEGLEEGNPGVIKGPGDEELPGDEESAGEEEDLPIAQQSQK